MRRHRAGGDTGCTWRTGEEGHERDVGGSRRTQAGAQSEARRGRRGAEARGEDERAKLHPGVQRSAEAVCDARPSTRNTRAHRTQDARTTEQTGRAHEPQQRALFVRVRNSGSACRTRAERPRESVLAAHAETTRTPRTKSAPRYSMKEQVRMCALVGAVYNLPPLSEARALRWDVPEGRPDGVLHAPCFRHLPHCNTPRHPKQFPDPPPRHLERPPPTRPPPLRSPHTTTRAPGTTRALREDARSSEDVRHPAQPPAP